MFKIETHCHSLGGSPCADTRAEDIVGLYVEKGYDGIVLTNHISPDSYSIYQGETSKEKARYYLSLIKRFRELCESNNLQVFFGAEVRANEERYAEYMLYGFDEKFLIDNKPLYELSQEELFRLADKNNLLMYQTHPFRLGVAVGNPNFMHGAESYNAHYHHQNNNELANEFCKKYNLIKMSGTDFHHIDQPIKSGIELNYKVTDNTQLVQAIVKKEYKLITD